MKSIIMNVVRDHGNDLYVSSWDTINNVIILTDNFNKIETHRTNQHATSLIEKIKFNNCRFIDYDTCNEIINPDLVAGQLIVETRFVPFDQG